MVAKLSLIFLILFSVKSYGVDIGVNFRASSGYVTDGANETYDIGEIYPVTRGGFTFGWDADMTGGARDRDSANDRRLAGINQVSNNGSSQRIWRLDMTQSGTFNIYLANGDNGGQDGQYFQTKDNTTILRTNSDADGTAADVWNDATGVERSEANWPSLNAADTYVFGSSIFFLLLGSPSSLGTQSSTLSHVRLFSVGVQSDPPFINSTDGSNIASATSIDADAISHTAGNLLVVMVGGNSTTVTVNSITDTAGNTYVQCASAYNNDQASIGFTDIWYAKNIIGNAANIVTVNYSGALDYRSVIVHQYSGLDTISPFEVAQKGSAAFSTTVTSNIFSTAGRGNVSVAVANVSASVSTWTKDPNYTARVTLVDPEGFSQDRLYSPTGSQTVSLTINPARDVGISVASFKIPPVNTILRKAVIRKAVIK